MGRHGFFGLKMTENTCEHYFERDESSMGEEQGCSKGRGRAVFSVAREFSKKEVAKIGSPFKKSFPEVIAAWQVNSTFGITTFYLVFKEDLPGKGTESKKQRDRDTLIAARNALKAACLGYIKENPIVGSVYCPVYVFDDTAYALP